MKYLCPQQPYEFLAHEPRVTMEIDELEQMQQIQKRSIAFQTDLTVNIKADQNIGLLGATAVAQRLYQYKNLRNLSLTIGEFNYISDKGIEIICDSLHESVVLDTLKISIERGNKINSEAVQSISQLISQQSNITSLSLILNSKLDEQAGIALTQAIEQLTKLNEMHINIPLFKNSENRKQLVMSSSLSILKTISKLSLEIPRSNNLGSDGINILIDSFKQCSSIQSLSLVILSGNGIDSQSIARLYNAIGTLQTLKSLNFQIHDFNSIDDESAQCWNNSNTLASPLEYLSISLAKNEITLEGAKHLANAILSFPKIQVLKLSLADSHISTEGARAMGNIFEKLLCLENLSFSLGRNGIKSCGAMGIGDGIGCCQKLKHLDLKLAMNQIGSDGLISICEGISNCTQLIGLSLTLQSNELVAEETNERTLKFNKMIRSLSSLNSLSIIINDQGFNLSAVLSLMKSITLSQSLRHLAINFYHDARNPQSTALKHKIIQTAYKITRLTSFSYYFN